MEKLLILIPVENIGLESIVQTLSGFIVLTVILFPASIIFRPIKVFLIFTKIILFSS